MYPCLLYNTTNAAPSCRLLAQSFNYDSQLIVGEPCTEANGDMTLMSYDVGKHVSSQATGLTLM